MIKYMVYLGVRESMTNNEYVLKVLFSCRTLGQLEACKKWVLKSYYCPEPKEVCIGERMVTISDLHDTIRDMEIYIKRL